MSKNQKYAFSEIEAQINNIFQNKWQELNESAELSEKFSKLFDRRNEGGYGSLQGRRGEGELPTWSPNEAYMQSLEWLWEDSEKILRPLNLGLDQSLRSAFYESREYKDQATEHRRVFFGQFTDLSSRLPVTSYMLSVPHSHTSFIYTEAPVIHVSKCLI